MCVCVRAQDHVPAAADRAPRGAQVPELVHVGRLGDVMGGGVHPPAAPPAAALLAHSISPHPEGVAPQR